ncbi:hypothetical protein GP486_008160 [Trichoglossum hirsutum]|uniref:Uncharacterized protein n=1 Tax=Trichoglossum hirsutum TaxID=265104 RepID=A0A9P8IAI1_9PEZI|nr:hypothetical protein GP486_008160 [Trichoglossum hirsutum]
MASGSVLGSLPLPSRDFFSYTTPQVCKPVSLALTIRKSYDPQRSCPLFRLPPEIRARIYEFAFSEYDDLENPYDRQTHYYRPGYHYRHRIDTALLMTCRLIYLEARLIPLYINEHVFFLSNGPPLAYINKRVRSNLGLMYLCQAFVFRTSPESYFAGLNEEQLDAVSHVHFFIPQRSLELEDEIESWASISNIPLMHLRKITITLRYADWRPGPLGLDPRYGTTASRSTGRGWGYYFRNIKGLDEFVMELEAIEMMKGQLEDIVRRASEWQFTLADGRVLVQERADTYTWMGPYMLILHTLSLEAGPDTPGVLNLPGSTLYVTVLRWTAREAENDDGTGEKAGANTTKQMTTG